MRVGVNTAQNRMGVRRMCGGREAGGVGGDHVAARWGGWSSTVTGRGY